MTYEETKRKLDEIRRKDEMLFRMAISHLIDVGVRNLTPTNIEETCAAIMTEDDSHAFMTNTYKCDLIKTAGQLAEFDHIYLLTYITRELYYDVRDDAIPYPRMLLMMKRCIGWITEQIPYGSPYTDLIDLGFTDNELETLGFKED